MASNQNATTLTHVLSLDDAIEQPRIAIENIRPTVNGGRFAAKAIAGRPISVQAVIFVDGHPRISAQVLWRQLGESQWRQVELTAAGNDEWSAQITVDRPGRVEFYIEAWLDSYLNLREEISKKRLAGVNVAVEMMELLALLGTQPDSETLLTRLQDSEGQEARLKLLLEDGDFRQFRSPAFRQHTSRSRVFLLDVDRRLAEFGSWYELFPRSQTEDAARHGTFDDVIKRLPDIVAMGFDILYFPPIHPIGAVNRKGPNNSLVAGDDDPGSPYAIGSSEGGHEAIHPELGTLEDFLRLVAAAKDAGLEIALDFAIQCSPDHPWLKQHPEWFSWRPDGSLRYAENPPKKYEDIVNVEFYAVGSMPALWLALRDVVLTWVERGVKIFRVDNPHTKPLPFWEWLMADVRSRDPDVIFLAEAFTRPAMMRRLGKAGFSQSYTYFTWRNTREELEQYMLELNSPAWRDCYRPNFFVNTPDINPFFLQHSGRAGFLIRAVLATMGSGSWGMYSGFEICESAAIPGKEEYLNSEKYEIRPRDYQQAGNIVAEITRLNTIRHQNVALQTHLGLEVYSVSNDNIILFGKRTADLSNFILIAVSLDPFNAQEAEFEIPLWEFGLPDHADLQGEDLMNGHRWVWHGKRQWMRIEPWHLPFGIWRIRP